MDIAKRKKIRSLISYDSPECAEMVQWLERNVGPENPHHFHWKMGENWVLYIETIYDRDYNKPPYIQWWVEFDARKIRRAQMTWFRLAWLL